MKRVLRIAIPLIVSLNFISPIARGDLLVSSLRSDEVLRYNATTGAFLGAFVREYSSPIAWPEGLVYGPDGNLYVSSDLTNNVLRYDGTTGRFLGVFTQGDELTRNTDLVFGPDGNLYVSNFGDFFGGHNPNSVVRYCGNTGAF